LKVDRQWHGHATKHSPRSTLAINIVTYANPGGAPLNLPSLAENADLGQNDEAQAAEADGSPRGAALAELSVY